LQRTIRLFSVVLLLIFITGLTAACGSSGNRSADQAAVRESAVENKAGGIAEASQPSVKRKIIKNADITVNVPDVSETLAAIESKVNQLNGYIGESSLHNHKNESRSGHITIRVPADKFTGMMQWLQETGKVQNKRIYTQDVTEEYIDLEARINNLNTQEVRLQEILSKAQTVEETLKVEKELERIRGELESLTGKLKFLNNRLDFSTINVTLQESVTANSNLSASGFNDFFPRSRAAFVASTNTLLKGAGNFLIFLIGALPLLLPLLLIAAVIWLLRKRVYKIKEKIQK